MALSNVRVLHERDLELTDAFEANHESKICTVCEDRVMSRYDRDYQGAGILRCPSCGFLAAEGVARESHQALVSAVSSSSPDRTDWIATMWSHRLDRLESLTNGRRLVDIGCARGTSAVAAEARGWLVKGVELDAASAAATVRRGIPCFVGDLHAFEETGFDAAILSQVLEHLSDPLAALKKVRTFLDANGVFLVSVPNVASLSSRAKIALARVHLASRPFRHLGLPRHRHFFTPAHLRTIAQQAGFEICAEECTPHSFPPRLPFYTNSARRLLGKVGLGGSIDLYLRRK